MDDFPLKLNDWINAFVSYNWLAVAIFLAILAGLANRLKGKLKIKNVSIGDIISGLYEICRDAWKVVRPPSKESKNNNEPKD